MNLLGLPPYEKHTQRRKETVSDEKYLAFLRKQKSAYSGRVPCVAAHYRTAANSGVGFKPPFSAIPLTRREHNTQHSIGTFNFMPKDWWEGAVMIHQIRFIQQGGVIPAKYILKS